MSIGAYLPGVYQICGMQYQIITNITLIMHFLMTDNFAWVMA